MQSLLHQELVLSSKIYEDIDFLRKSRMILKVNVHKHHMITLAADAALIRGCKGFDGGVEAR